MNVTDCYLEMYHSNRIPVPVSMCVYWGGRLVGFFPYTSNALIVAGCPTIQCSSGTIYPETASDPKAQACKTVSIPFQRPIASLGCYLYLLVWLNGCKSEVPMAPYLGSINLLDRLTRLRKPVYSLNYPTSLLQRLFINSQMKKYKVCGKGEEFACPPQEHCFSWHLQEFSNPAL